VGFVFKVVIEITEICWDCQGPEHVSSFVAMQSELDPLQRRHIQLPYAHAGMHVHKEQLIQIQCGGTGVPSSSVCGEKTERWRRRGGVGRMFVGIHNAGCLI